MIFLVVIASVLIAAITIYQYNEQADDYHNDRLQRKEEAIKSAIIYELERDSLNKLHADRLEEILDKKLNEISDIHNLDINVYDTNGTLMRSSFVKNSTDTVDANLDRDIMDKIVNSRDHRVVLNKLSADGKKFKSSFSYLTVFDREVVGIIGVPYMQDNTFQDEELKEFLGRLFMVYVLILVIAIALAYFLSKYITKSLESISRKIRQTAFDKTNERIFLTEGSEEIMNLVDSYNSMVEQIENSALKLAESERKSAWREMARQVAHEIKNPLTPMRLTVQSFNHNFDPSDPMIKEKLNEFCESLIQQIDIMSSIASAFSNFAQMPKANKEELNVVDVVKKGLDIFHEPFIKYRPEGQSIVAKLDKVQLNRIITNLVTNAIQAIKDIPEPRIEVRVFERDQMVMLEVEDNGSGISEEARKKVFEPKFTTKSSGMGLGLPMVKNIVEAYKGTVSFAPGQWGGTLFSVSLPKF